MMFTKTSLALALCVNTLCTEARLFTLKSGQTAEKCDDPEFPKLKFTKLSSTETIDVDLRSPWQLFYKTNDKGWVRLPEGTQFGDVFEKHKPALLSAPEPALLPAPEPEDLLFAEYEIRKEVMGSVYPCNASEETHYMYCE